MNDDNRLHLSMKRMILILVLYFGGYLFLFPYVTTIITLMLNPHATTIAFPLVICTYVISIGGALYLTLPIWRQSIRNFKTNYKKDFTWIVYLTVTIFVLNLFMSMVVSFMTGNTTSNNQVSISTMSEIAPLFTFVASVIFAPILEESVFRGGVFTPLRNKLSFVWTALISSVLFGSIHIINSLLSGDMVDVSYLLLYSVMGLVLAYGYEKSNSIIVPVGIHLLNNFIVMSMMMWM